MPIIKPQDRLVVTSDDEHYKLSLNLLASRERLDMYDERLIQEMARFKPNTRVQEGDIVYLIRVPPWLNRRQVLPRFWKVRFVVTNWAYRLMHMAIEARGMIALEEAVAMLQAASNFTERRAMAPMVFAHGYPHGAHPDSAEWVPEQLLKRTEESELTASWDAILDEAEAPYIGYQIDHNINFDFDLQPSEYSVGRNLSRPFRAEEPVVHTLCSGGSDIEELLFLPYSQDNYQPPEIDPEHDIFARDE